MTRFPMSIAVEVEVDDHCYSRVMRVKVPKVGLQVQPVSNISCLILTEEGITYAA